MTQTNNLIHTTTRRKGDKQVKIKIRLNDECKNGHQDFAITGDVYEIKGDKAVRVSSGCCHEDIVDVAPEFKQFVRLHLCDYLGRPMYASANGFYHLRKGFNNTPTDSPEFATEFCEYYRITPEQFTELDKSETELQYNIALLRLGIIDQWKVEADVAIKTLEELTGQKFVVDSTRSQYTPATMEQIEEEEERIAAGYYTPEAKQQRERAKADSIIAKMREQLEARRAEAELEFTVKCAVLEAGGPKALKACIFYNHSKTLAFNWTSFDRIPDSEAARVIAAMALPAGVKTEITGAEK